MNIKKMFTTLSAMVVAVTMTLPSASVFGANYSQELQDAYNWAHEKGVTTMDSIDNANMYGAITRAQMAKMLSVYAKGTLGKELDTSKACEFNDIDSVKGDLHDFIIESCQLGIMGQGISSFRPYDTISRAEFGTALSRVLWGNENEGGTPYYAKHLDALKAAGIMTQIDNPENRDEVRGYVMLMLMRSDEGAGVDCDDPVVALACLDPELDAYKECPAACRDNGEEDKDEDGVVRSGDLEVSASESAGRKILANGVSDMDTLKFKSSEDVEISKVVLERYGYSTNDSVASVRLENEDGVVISNEVEGLNTKGQANLTIKKDYRNVDGTMNATIVIKASSKAGETIGFKVVDVNSSAKNLNVDNYKPYTYDVVEYSGAYVDFTVRNTEKTHNIEAGKLYEVSKFKIKAPADSSILVKGFTLTNSGGVSLDKYASEVEVSVAGKDQKVTWNINKDDELVIAFEDDVEVEAKANAEIVVKASFAEDFDEYNQYIQLYLDENADFSALDSKTESRVTVDPDVLGSAKAVNWPVYKIAGGKVKLTNTKLGNVDASQNSTDIVVAEGKISVPETIKGDLTVKVNGNSQVVTAAGATTGISYMVEAMRLKVGGDEYEGKKPSTYAASAADVEYTFKNVEIDRDSKVQFLIDVRDSDLFSGKSVTFSIEGKGWSDFYYTEGKSTDKIDAAGSISFSKVTFQAAKASLTNTLSKAVEFKNGEQSDRKEVFNGVYTAKKGDIKLNAWSLVSSAASTATGTVNFYLLIDGEEVADLTYDAAKYPTATTFSKSDTFSDVEIAAEKTAKIVIEADVNAKGTGSLGKFTLNLEGEDVNGNKAGNASKATVELKIVDKGSASVSAASSSKKTVLRAASNTQVAEFVIKPANGASELDVDEISFTALNGTTVLGANDIEVTIDDVIQDSVNGVSTTYEPTNLKAKSEGVNVKVSIQDEKYGEVSISNLKVNGKASSTEFNSRFEEAVVRISSLRDLGGSTEFTLDVDADADVTVGDLSITFDVEEDGTTPGTAYTAIAGSFDKDDTFEANGAVNKTRQVRVISYKVYGSDRTDVSKTNVPATPANCTLAIDAAATSAAATAADATACAALAVTDKVDAAYASSTCTLTIASAATTAANAAKAKADPAEGAAACDAIAVDGKLTATYAAAREATSYYTVTINKDGASKNYPDFFKVGSNGYARAYQSNK